MIRFIANLAQVWFHAIAAAGSKHFLTRSCSIGWISRLALFARLRAMAIVFGRPHIKASAVMIGVD